MRAALRRLAVSAVLGGLALGALSPIIAVAADPAGSLTPTRRASSMDPLPATRVMPPKPPLPDSPPLPMAEPMSAVPPAGAPDDRAWFQSPDWSDAVWTGLAAAALAVALAIGVWALRRAGAGARASDEGPAPTRSAKAPRKRATAQTGIAERFEQERAKAALRRVLADSAVETPETEDDVHAHAAPAGEDPNRILLLTSPEARRRAALDRARRNAELARPPRPLGFSYAASRRRQHLVEASTKPARATRPSATPEAVSPPVVSDEAGVPDKGARISSVIRGMKAFDARTKAQQPGRHPRQGR